jgi:hypothetical protein
MCGFCGSESNVRCQNKEKSTADTGGGVGSFGAPENGLHSPALVTPYRKRVKLARSSCTTAFEMQCNATLEGGGRGHVPGSVQTSSIAPLILLALYRSSILELLSRTF